MGSEALGLEHQAAIIMTAVAAHVVRALQFAAIVAFMEGLDLQRIMRAPIAPAMRRYFSLGDGHGGTCSKRLKINT